MRRALLALPLLILPAVASGAASAATTHALPHSAEIIDPTGDWAVAGEDVVHGVISGKAKRLHVDLQLAAAVPQTPSYYQVQFKAGCHLVILAVTTANGAPVENYSANGATVDSSFYSSYSCTPSAAGQYDAVESKNLVPKIVGTHIVWDVPYIAGLARGVKVSSIGVLTNRAGLNGPVVMVGTRPVTATVGDRAAATFPFSLD